MGSVGSRRSTLVVVAVIGSGVLAGASPAALSPHALYMALFTKPYPNAQLPAGYTDASIQTGIPSTAEQKYGSVGSIGVDVTPAPAHLGAFIHYAVFPTSSAARRYLQWVINHPGVSGHRTGRIPGMTQPSAVFRILSGQTYKRTDMEVAIGNVLVRANADSPDGKSYGYSDALALVKSAVAHLRAVNR